MPVLSGVEGAVVVGLVVVVNVVFGGAALEVLIGALPGIH